MMHQNLVLSKWQKEGVNTTKSAIHIPRGHSVLTIMKNSIIIIILLLQSLAVQSQQIKSILFQEEIHDFGNIPEQGGPVKHDFIFVNNSPRPIKVLSVKASCGCTTPDWSKDPIQPGKTGFVQASYDPKGRPGFFNKSLTITTDLDGNAIILQIKGEVVQGVEAVSNEFTVVNGSWRLKAKSFNLGKVYLKDQFVAKEYPFINGGEKAVTFLDKVQSPSYIRISVIPKTVKPGEQGTLRVSYNGKMKGQYGFQSDNVMIHTDDESEPDKSFSIFATLEDYFPPLSQKERAEAPIFKSQFSAFEFGRVPVNATTERQITVSNTGKKDLLIRSIQTNCACVKATAEKTTLKGGESTTVTISFNSEGRTSTQQKAIIFYTNDPENPVQRITFTAYID
jgi:Protein of unknown function (DUF1573)